MRIIINLLFILFFTALLLIVMFVGGVSGVAGSFYLMVTEGDIVDNLIKGIGALSVALILVMILSGQNRKVLKQKQQRLNEQQQKDDD